MLSSGVPDRIERLENELQLEQLKLSSNSMVSSGWTSVLENELQLEQLKRTADTGVVPGFVKALENELQLEQLKRVPSRVNLFGCGSIETKRVGK